MNIFSLKTQDLKALVEYKEIIEENKAFQKGFWTEEKEQIQGVKQNSRLFTQYCLENIAGINPKELPKYSLGEIKELLIQNKLFGMVQIVFKHDILAALKNAYPEEFTTRLFKEWMWSKRGLWQDNALIIEAVEDMVRKEGIRRLRDIPRYDWKKRLLKHGIYNVLAKFNWSIFALFNFVYPDKFNPNDFKYKIKWATSEFLENALYLMHVTFKKKKLSKDDILLLGTSDFRRMGLAGMLMSVFNSSTLEAKEYYFYMTIANESNQSKLLVNIKRLKLQRKADAIKRRIREAAEGNSISNLNTNSTLYGFIKRHAKEQNLFIDEFLAKYGFVYKNAKKRLNLSKETIWEMRKQGLSYVQIAEQLKSNPTTISEFCKRNFGGDPLIPRPLDNYITVQELMNKYHVDHKTIMKIVNLNKFENHTTIRFRFLKKSEIEPALNDYITSSSRHAQLKRRYPG